MRFDSTPGGSIRCPSSHNGLYGLRPTARRLSLLGTAGPLAACHVIDPTEGPMSTSLDGIKIFMETALASRPWEGEPSLLPLPWRSEKSHLERDGVKRLKVAVMWNDGVVEPHPPVTRALKALVVKLEIVAGIDVVQWQPYRHDIGLDIMVIKSSWISEGNLKNALTD